MKTKKNDFWTQGKITDLIKLYQNSECLWNVLTEDYKSREKRDIAISSICSSLNITREQFSKKIHNLRNQFNYEAKKITQRNDHAKNSYRSKWEYYDKLLFLKNVIAPRPGPNYVLSDYEIQNSNNSEVISIENVKTDKTQSEIVHILKTKPGLENNVLIYHEIPSAQENSTVEQQIISNNNNTYPTIAIQRSLSSHQQPDNYSQEIASPQSKQKTEEKVQNKPSKIEKRQEMSTRSRKKQITSPPVQKSTPRQEQDNSDIQTFETSINDSPPKKIIKRDPSQGNSNKINQEQQYPKQRDNQLHHCRDEYDVFGEFVASELRDLNHIYRKKLKRRIMRAMLETANEDDKSE